MFFQTSALVPDNKLMLNKVYISKRPINCILMICQDVQQERKQLNTLLIATYRYDKVLDWQLATLTKEEKFCWSTKEALMK